ncbi:signal recognition particle protein Srp54 [Encephalitozoon intestinalis ATCC 50506]|uniref:signal-recognition-particle GTPase n=1 Tax=Encephalitozoon intestinalis (strain ATCC 50506) TaxID=876142 RepID=E0S6P9_ENCIT|nr:signal recognition particle protein Srp54 [Encephalitozoon intestinalis ATCC 50506]ADM11384.1 signal recognition particle protein Srp54 [Encephalitozoon intestinalis ATCC 50506]UTX45074.1 signal recognition particle protein Srp54 [Encephalitozoon intestinalis]
MITELGKSITNTLSNLLRSRATDQDIEAAIKEICHSLILSNVNPRYVSNLRNELKARLDPSGMAPGLNKARVVQNAVYEKLVDLLDPKAKGYKIEKGKTSIIVFVGLQGSGKTTSICKYANFYKKKGFKVGIVCADTFRAGAFDQVRQNALKIKVPFFGSSEADPVKVAGAGVERFRRERFEVILVDTSGRHTQESELFVEMKDIMREVRPDSIVFVMDAGIGQSAEDQAIGFKKAVNVGSIILTKIDGTNKAGGAISSVAATGCPIEFVGNGEGMEDLEVFDARRFVSRMLGMGDVEGLMEKVESLGIDEKEVVRKLKQGKFTLGDFYDQFQKILSLGPISKLLEMMPGFSGLSLPDEESFKKLIYIFDSLSRGELDSTGQMFEKEPSRIMRVARGSGTSVQGVVEILTQFKKAHAVMQKISSIPGIESMMGNPSSMSLTQKAKLKEQAKNILPKDLLDKMASMF